MTTLVTGGKGFVGRHLVNHLVEQGEAVVSYNRDFAVDTRPSVTTVQGELFDIPVLVKALTDNRVDKIIHTAGMSHPGVSVDLPLTTIAANIDGTAAVFEAARMAGVRRIVNFSSECAYGNLDETVLVQEDAKPTPTTPYGVTKVAGELLGNVYNNLYGTEIVSLRVTEVYGPGLWMPSLLGDLLNAALSGSPFTLASGGDHKFQFVYVQDVAAAAYLASVAADLTQPVYHVSGGTQITVAETADTIRTIFPEAKFEIGPGHIEKWDRQGKFDLSASERDLGYRPAWSLADGLAASVQWIQAQGG
ncbi:NAD-dependent epimerase/dehydratase family protein [Rhodococcus sp. A14]|uniref:NAD-dependent epimerase/dehydratase family protein n=1 Tax=Rhodococcus sp. A14 TaxID=1194106 RepID=UPI0014203567|nr:NAD-dependent epimerase/dehydratase family protein [Rhodococcus sp. A14]